MFRATCIVCTLGAAFGLAGCSSLRPPGGTARAQHTARELADDPYFSQQQRQFVETDNALAVLQARRGHYERARRLLLAAIEQAPRAAYLFNNLGYVALLGGRLSEARADFEHADRLAPGDPFVRANITRLRRALELRGSDVRRVASTRRTRTLAVPPAPNHRGLRVITTASGQLVVRRIAPNVFVLCEPAAAAVTAVTAVAAVAASPRTPPPSRQAPARRVRRLDVVNGNGVDGMARRVANYLSASTALPQAHLFNQIPYRQASTEIQYREGMLDAALLLQRVLPEHPALVAMTATCHDACDLRIVLGRDAVRWGSTLRVPGMRMADAKAGGAVPASGVTHG